MRSKQRVGMGDIREGGQPPPLPLRARASRSFLWGGVALALLVLGAIALVALRPTTATVVPRSHAVLFDETARFTAYPAETAVTGTLPFTIETSTFEDSQVVPAKGTERVEDRAQGSITVYNDYSSASVKLIKNTRFQTPSGLVFRAPAEVIVPGRKGSTPGQISITVFADKPGEQYNIGPVEKFTLPGLASGPEYSKVYARSSAPTVGGFAGERPAATPAALEAAQAEIRGRLQEKALASARVRESAETFAFFDLAHLTFESLPPTTEGKEGVRIHERARMELPLFPVDKFAYVVGESVSASAESGSIVLKTGEGFGARPEGAVGEFTAGSPLSFTLRGSALLIWKVDTEELAGALAGRDKAAFQAIVKGFPGIEEAHARIEPFWKSSFPADPAAIKIKVQEPNPATNVRPS